MSFKSRPVDKLSTDMGNVAVATQSERERERETTATALRMSLATV